MRLLPLALIAALMLGAPRAACSDGGCKPDGQQCQTNISCCSRQCLMRTVQHGKALFGMCCTPTTCAGKCGTIPDGDCGDTLTCGTCTAPQTCGGGGTPNICGCTPKTTADCTASDCGTTSDGCGGTIECPCLGGTCTCVCADNTTSSFCNDPHVDCRTGGTIGGCSVSSCSQACSIECTFNGHGGASSATCAAAAGCVTICG